MANDKTMKGMVSTVIDGIKDAEKQCEYAKAAKEAGNQQLAMAHYEEAKRRMQGVQDWRKRLRDMPERGRDTDVEEAMWERYDDDIDKLTRKLQDWNMNSVK